MNSVIDIMSQEVHTLGEQNSLSEARQLMTEHRIRHIPIVDDQHNLLGLVSQRDVLAAEESSILDIKPQQRLDREQRIIINDFYRRDVMSITQSTSLHKAALTMQKYKIGCLPVLDGDKLVGLITDSDFVNVAINLMEVMAAAEPEDLG